MAQGDALLMDRARIVTSEKVLVHQVILVDRVDHTQTLESASETNEHFQRGPPRSVYQKGFRFFRRLRRVPQCTFGRVKMKHRTTGHRRNRWGGLDSRNPQVNEVGLRRVVDNQALLGEYPRPSERPMNVAFNCATFWIEGE